ncbi:MAG: hypothetical protein K0S07_1543, partial [Chlamydiales bacterium]|nr:hypothetical protein [Chlamydiales bacterium]
EFPKQQGKEIAEQLDNLSKQTGTDKQKSECEQQILLGSKTAPHSEKLANYVQYWAQDICLTIPDSPGEYLMIDKEGTALRVSKGDIEEGIRMKEERQGEKKLSRQLFELEDLFLDPAQTNKGKELMIYNGYRLLDRSKETVLDGNLYLESEKNPSHYFVVDKKGSVNTVLKTDFERLKLEAEQKE